MLRRTMTAVLAITFVLAAGSAMAQSCLIGLYGDTDGTVSTFRPKEFTPFDVYAVLSVESTANAVAMTVTWPVDVINSVVGYGPSGGGINVASANGDNIGLGECAIGFGGAPIVVAHYSGIEPGILQGERVISIGANADEDPTFPVYADCNGGLHTCENTLDLVLGFTIAVEGKSFGSVKSLYNN